MDAADARRPFEGARPVGRLHDQTDGVFGESDGLEEGSGVFGSVADRDDLALNSESREADIHFPLQRGSDATAQMVVDDPPEDETRAVTSKGAAAGQGDADDSIAGERDHDRLVHSLGCLEKVEPVPPESRLLRQQAIRFQQVPDGRKVFGGQRFEERWHGTPWEFRGD